MTWWILIKCSIQPSPRFYPHLQKSVHTLMYVDTYDFVGQRHIFIFKQNCSSYVSNLLNFSWTMNTLTGALLYAKTNTMGTKQLHRNYMWLVFHKMWSFQVEYVLLTLRCLNHTRVHGTKTLTLFLSNCFAAIFLLDSGFHSFIFREFQHSQCKHAKTLHHIV